MLKMLGENPVISRLKPTVSYVNQSQCWHQEWYLDKIASVIHKSPTWCPSSQMGVMDDFKTHLL